jgi:TonB-dependent receptor
MFLLPAFSQAQIIRGTVTGGTLGQLPGASIKIKGSGQTAISDLGGFFSLDLGKADNAQIVISYTGFADREIEVVVKPGNNELGVIELTPAAGQLGDVIVRGTIAGSQSRAYSIKKNSLGIMEVLSADAIGKLPDRNAAEAVQRIQGVAVARYHGEADQATVRGTPFAWTSTLFNGSRLPSANVYGTRASILDAVPSEMIQYVQVSKALTPNMEGDAIGGSINFITRTAPVKRMLNMSAAGGYNAFSQDGTFNGSLVYGDRFLKNKLGVIISAAVWDRNWGADSYDVSYNTGLFNDTARKSINAVQFKRYMGRRQTYGGNAGLEYKFNSSNKLFARMMLTKFNDIRPVYESLIDYTASRYTYNYRYSEYQTKLNGFEVGGIHSFGNRWNLNWQASKYVSQFFIETPNTTPSNQRGLPIAQFRQRITGGFNGLSSDGRKYWNFDSPNGVGDDPMHFNANLKNKDELMDPSKLLLSQLVIAQLDNKEDDKIAGFDLSNKINDKLKISGGLKYRNKQRDGINFATIVHLPNASLGIPGSAPLRALGSFDRTDFPVRSGFFKHYAGDQSMYIIDPLTKQQLFDLYDTAFLRQNSFGEYSLASNATTRYNGHENVMAGYLMAEYDVNDKLKVVAGFRNEYTSLELNSSRLETVRENGQTVNRITPTKANNDYNNLLPMLNIKYSIRNNANIRAAYTRTFIRPNFNDLIPNENTNTTTIPITVTKGNPELNPTYSDNFDLMGEYYFNNIGLISGGVFYKKIKDVVFTDRRVEMQDGQSYLFSQPKNLKNSYLVGVEAGINRRFDFLKGFWSGFGVEFNYTFIYSEVKVPRLVGTNTVVDKSSLPNQSRNIYNAILFYERKGVMVRLAANYRGKSVETINQQLGPQYNIWTDKNLTLDASASVTITPRVRTFVELNNLTNEPLKTFMGEQRRVTMVEWYGQRGQAGIRWDIIK